MVIGCCDFRVSPEVIFDAGPGELFVVRNVANLVPVFQPDGGAHGVSAALEYAVNVLRIKHIVVLGHAQCGGIRAFIDNIEPLSPGDFIGRWMQMFIKPGENVEQRERESEAGIHHPDREGPVFRSLENLMTFPFVRTLVERGEMNCTAPISASPKARCSCSIRTRRNFAASGVAMANGAQGGQAEARERTDTFQFDAMHIWWARRKFAFATLQTFLTPPSSWR